MNRNKIYLLSSIAAAGLASSQPGFAQDAPGGGTTAVAPQDEASTGEVSLRSDIVVRGRRGKMVNSGGLGARSILDTPFSVTAVTEEEIADRMAVSVDEILKGDSSARTASNGVASILPEVTVRGLLLDQLNSYKIDGMTFPNRSSLPVEHYQQVELLKGLSGFMYGFGTPGGIVNYITKRPLPETSMTAGASFNSDATFRGLGDLSVRAGANGGLGLRVVGVHEEGDTYIDNDGYVRRSSVSGAVTAELGSVVTLLADGLYQKRRSEGVIFAVYLPAANAAIPMLAPIDGRTNLAESGSYFQTETAVGTIGMDFNIAQKWKANISYRTAEANANWREGNVNVNSATGNYTFQEFTSRQTHSYEQVQGLMIGKADTGPLEHDLTFGASWQKLEQFNDRTPGTHNLVGTSNLYNPVQIRGSFIDGSRNPLFLTLEITQRALFASDTISWGNLALLVGARMNEFKQVNRNASGAVTATYSTTPITPTVALRFKPRADTTVYASYVEALEKGGQASVINANFGDIFGPLKSKQYEAGAKIDQRMWGANFAIFRILRGAEYTTAANIYVQDGLARYQGIELGLTFRPVAGLSLHAEGSYLDAKLVEAAVNVGKRIPGAAEWQGAVQIEYAPQALPGLKFVGGVRYLGESKLEASNLRTVPGFTTTDLALRYTLPIAMPITFNVAVKNITDKDYWTIRNSGTPALQQGAPRTVAAGVSVTF